MMLDSATTATPSPSASAVATFKTSAAACDWHSKVVRSRRSNNTGNSTFSISKMLTVVLMVLVVILVTGNWSLHGLAMATTASTASIECERHLLHGTPTISAPPTTTTITNSNSLMIHTNTTSNVVYFVFSRHNAFALRKTIRNTWGNNKNNNNNLFFVIGRPCWIPPNQRGVDLGGNEACTIAPKPLYNKFAKQAAEYKEKFIVPVEEKIREERLLYKDILQMPDHIYDSYGSLPDKLKAAYTFVVEELLPSVDFVVKVDDDFFVQMDHFTNHLNDNYGHLAKQNVPTLIGGRILTDHHAFTDGKWKELPQWKPGGMYPPFPMGSYGHVVTRPIFEYVAKNKELLFNYQGEDNSLGIWIKQSPVLGSAKGGTDAVGVKYIESPVMEGNGDCMAKDKFLVGHDIDKAKMVECQEALTAAATSDT